jgi:hypothetical protein
MSQLCLQVLCYNIKSWIWKQIFLCWEHGKFNLYKTSALSKIINFLFTYITIPRSKYFPEHIFQILLIYTFFPQRSPCNIPTQNKNVLCMWNPQHFKKQKDDNSFRTEWVHAYPMTFSTMTCIWLEIRSETFPITDFITGRYHTIKMTNCPIVALGGLVLSVLATGPKVRAFEFSWGQ